MSIVSELIAGGAAGLFQGIGSFAKSIREAITGESILDPNKRAELLLNAQALEAASVKAKMDYDQAISTAQNAVNALEAQSKSLFVAGWRPAVGWVCVLGLFYTFLLKPLFPWFSAIISNLAGVAPVVPALPEVPTADLLVLLGGMLGLGGLRTYEKVMGVESK